MKITSMSGVILPKIFQTFQGKGQIWHENLSAFLTKETFISKRPLNKGLRLFPTFKVEVEQHWRSQVSQLLMLSKWNQQLCVSSFLTLRWKKFSFLLVCFGNLVHSYAKSQLVSAKKIFRYKISSLSSVLMPNNFLILQGKVQIVAGKLLANLKNVSFTWNSPLKYIIKLLLKQTFS